jgi:antitoxin component YwqK of YwqJK toxin-antitoxin module
MRRAAFGWLALAPALAVGCAPHKTTWAYDGAPLRVATQRDGIDAGRSVWFGPQGRLVSGDLIGQLRQGVWKTWYPGAGLMEQTVWSQGMRTGPSRSLWPDGSLQCAGEFARDQRVGEWRFFLPDGRVDAERSGFYVDGVRR